MTRITDFNQNQTMVSYLMRSAEQQAATEEQIASGKKALNFADIPGDTGVLLSAKSVEANLEQFTRTSNEILNRLGFQDIQLSEMEAVHDEVRQLVTQTVAIGSAQNFNEELDGIFQRLVSLLNSSVDGKYLYSGTRTDTPPVNIATLADLAALPVVANAFDNNTLKPLVKIDDNETVRYGLLASDIGMDIFQKIKDIKTYYDTFGPLTGTLSPADQTFLEGEIAGLVTSTNAMTGVTASNGRNQRQVENAVIRHAESESFVKTFIGNIEDVDLAEAISRLNMNQLQSEATAKVIAQLTRVSLLDFLR